jgi:hypothetical protein
MQLFLTTVFQSIFQTIKVYLIKEKIQLTIVKNIFKKR